MVCDILPNNEFLWKTNKTIIANIFFCILHILLKVWIPGMRGHLLFSLLGAINLFYAPEGGNIVIALSVCLSVHLCLSVCNSVTFAFRFRKMWKNTLRLGLQNVEKGAYFILWWQAYNCCYLEMTYIILCEICNKQMNEI